MSNQTWAHLMIHYPAHGEFAAGIWRCLERVERLSEFRGSVMDYAVREIAPQVWRIDIAGAVRIIRYRPDSMTFAPWDICTEDGHRLWASSTLESALRWIEARTGHPAEALLVEALLEQGASPEPSEPAEGTAERVEPGVKRATPGSS